MTPQDEHFLRRLSLALTTFVLLLSLLTTYVLQYMPNDPLHIRRNFTLYSLFVTGCSGAGLIGAVKRNPTLLSLFASHLLLDSIFYLIPRIIILNFSVRISSLVCTPSEPTARDDEIYRVSHNPRIAQKFLSSKRCQTMSYAFECCIVSGAIILMVLQFWLGLKIRRYSQYLERKELQGSTCSCKEHHDVEKTLHKAKC